MFKFDFIYIHFFDNKMNNLYRISINACALNRILAGKKTIEGRIKRGIFKTINIGDLIYFYNRNIECQAKIINIIEYKNILEYLSCENLEKINPNKSKEDILDIYKKCYPNILDKSKDFLAIRFKLIDI